MASLSHVAEAAGGCHLSIFGAFHPEPDTPGLTGTGTLVLLGPAGSPAELGDGKTGFWPHVSAQPEFTDGAPDPLDRWSRRVIGGLASTLGATALFPFDRPFLPFFSWALTSGAAWASPVQLLIHAEAGLLVSYRGALAFADRMDLPQPPQSRPCDACAAPCATACPVGALTPAGYDLSACHAHLDTPDGADCMDKGCAVRRACPVSESYGRLQEQSAFHMRVFHP